MISHPERLGIELISDAVAQNPNAFALNYARLAYGDQLVRPTRDRRANCRLSARIIVNATGA